MANLKNWLPNMDPEERMWFDACPKAVLYAIAQQFAMRVGDDFTAEGAFEVMQAEWSALHSNGVVPQKPFDVAKARAKVRAKVEAFLAKRGKSACG